MQADQKQILKSFFPPLIFIIVLWIVKGIEIYYHLDFGYLGVYPRHVEGLRGVILMPFLHANINHLFSNSIPLLILGATLIYFYKELAMRVFLLVYLLDGIWLWLGGRENYHIGASGIVYGLSSFVFFSGIFRRDTRLIAISMLVVFLYGGLVWGMFPSFLGEQVSWEAHLYGAAAGVLCAYVYRKEGPQRKQYEWENEEDNATEIKYWEVQQPETTEQSLPQPPEINYEYKPTIPPNQQDETKTSA